MAHEIEGSKCSCGLQFPHLSLVKLWESGQSLMLSTHVRQMGMFNSCPKCRNYVSVVCFWILVVFLWDESWVISVLHEALQGGRHAPENNYV